MRIFRTLLVAAVNAIKEFLAFATKNCLQDTLIFDIVGNVTILGKKFTDFSQNNYIQVPLYSYDNTLEFVIHYITSPSSVSNAALIMPCNTADGLTLRQNGTTFYAWAGNSSHWNALNSFNTGVPIDVNQERWIKINVNGTSISFSYSADGETWTAANTGTLSAKINFTNGIGLGAGITDSYNPYNWGDGTILLGDCYFQYDDTKLVPYLYPKQLNDTIKLNDGIASSNYDWSACQDNEYGQFTATGTIEQIKEVNGETVYVTAEPEPDDKNVKINTGEIYYAYTNENDSDDSVYTIDDPIIPAISEWTQPKLTANGSMGGNTCAVQTNITLYSGVSAYYGFDGNNSTTFHSASGSTVGYFTFYSPTAIKVSSIQFRNQSGINSRASKGGTVYGSNDNTTWTEITTYTHTDTASQIWSIDLSSNTNSYKYYKVDSIGVISDSYWVFEECTFIGVIEQQPSILYDDTFTALNPQPEFTVGINSITVTSETPNITYNKNTDNNKVKSIECTINTVDNTTIQSVTINCPTEGKKDIYYYGYTNNSDESIYITDSEPITSTTFNLQNAKIIGTINNDNGVFSNFSRGNYIQLINPRPVHSFDFIIKCKPGSGTSFGRLIQTQPDVQGIALNCTTSSVNCYVSRRTGYGWDVLNNFVTGITMSANTEIYVRITWNDTDGVYRFYQSSNGIDWEAKNYSDSGKLSPYWVNNSQTIGANTDSYYPWNGSVDMNETKLTIDGVTLTYKKQQPISVLYENIGTTEFIPEVIEPQPTFTVQDEGLINCINDNCTISSDGWATGGSNKKLVSTFIPNLSTASNWEFQCTFEYNGGGSSSYGQSILGLATGGGAQIPSLCAFSNGFRMCLSSNGSSWNICDVSKKEYTLTTGQIYNIKFGFTGTEYYLDVKRDEETDFPIEHYWSLSSTTKVYNNTTVYMELMNYAGLESSMYFIGPIDLNKTCIIADGVRTNFYNSKSGIIIGNDLYERNSEIDSFQTITTNPAVIETNAIITQPNNDIFISDGRYVILNLTAPSSMTTYIQSSGINYQLLDMPLLLKRNSGVGLLIKDNNTILYRRSWTLERDLDLHYQIVKFNLNVDNANIVFKVDNREIPYPYIVYSGDKYTYTISKEDYIDYNGSGTVSYNSKDGNEIDINIALIPSAGTVDTTDYTYTIDNEGNMIITGYVGTNADTTTPNITEN